MKENYELDKDVTLSYIKSPACPGVAMSWCSECLIFAKALDESSNSAMSSMNLMRTIGRRPSMEEDLWQKTTFDGRGPLTEDDLWQKTTFDWRQPLTEDDHLKKCLRLLTLTATAQMTPNQKSYQLSKPEIEFHMMEEMYAALCMRGCAEKTTFLGKDN